MKNDTSRSQFNDRNVFKATLFCSCYESTQNQVAYGGKATVSCNVLLPSHFPRRCARCRRESTKHNNDIDDFHIVRKRDNRHRFEFHEHRRSLGRGFHVEHIEHIAAWHHRCGGSGGTGNVFRSIRVLLILPFIFIIKKKIVFFQQEKVLFCRISGSN